MNTSHTYKSCFLLAIWISVLLCACSVFGVASEPRASLLDRGANSVTALDTNTAAILGTASFEGGYLTMIQIPHSKRLAVFNRGTGKGILRKASMSFVDMDSMKITSYLELGWGIGQVLPTDDGKGVAVVCPGYTSQKPEENLPAEVVLINTEMSQIKGRFPVQMPVGLMFTPDNRTLITFTSAWRNKDRSRNPEVQFVEFDTGKMLGKLSPSKAVTRAELSDDGQYLYLLDPGGFLAVVSVSTRSELSAIDLGSAPRGFIHDQSDRILILSDAAPAEKGGEMGGALRVFKGTEAVAVTPVAHSPQLLMASPDGTVLYVAGSDGVSLVDSSTFKTIGEIPIAERLRDLAITPDGKRGIALFSGDRVMVLDLEQKKSLASLRTGRGFERFAQTAGPALFDAADSLGEAMDNFMAEQLAQMEANTTGQTQYYTVRHTDFTGKWESLFKTSSPSVSVAISPDSKFAYAVNGQTHDITVIDTQAATVLSKIGIRNEDSTWAQGYKIATLPGGNAVAILGPLSITFIDTKTNQKINDRLKVGGLGGILHTFQVSPSGTRACALVSKRIVCVDTSTLKEVGRQEHFKNLEMILFEH